MTGPRVQIGVAVAFIGILVAADTLLLLHLGRRLFPSQNILSLTAGYVVLQEAILFGLLVYITMTAGRSSNALPVQLGYVSVSVTCSLIALLIIAIFDALLMFGVVDINAFWTALAMQQASLLIFLLGIHIVGIIQRASHQQAEQQRAAVEDVAQTCDRISISAKLAGWEIDGKIGEAGEHLRFCNALRRDQTLYAEVLARLSELEALARIGGHGEPKTRAERLLNEVLILSSQRG